MRNGMGSVHAVAASPVRMTRVYLGIGSNLQGPIQQVRQAIMAIAGLPQTQLMAQSRLYRSAPMGPQPQPDYINAVVCVDTDLAAAELLEALHGLEQTQGRVRDGSRWGPRTLDVDILLYGDESINQPQLVVPHPGLHERNFVLYPLSEIAPALVIPGRGALSDLLARCPTTGLEPVA